MRFVTHTVAPMLISGVMVISPFNFIDRLNPDNFRPAAPESVSVRTEQTSAENEQIIAHDGPSDEFVGNANIPLSNELQKHITMVAAEYELDPNLIFAMIWNESGCKMDVVGYNKNGTFDTGLMCINSSLGFTKQELLDPYRNVDIGVSIIAEKVNRYGEYYGLMAYNMGNAGMQRARKRGQTQNYYANKILKTKHLLEKEGRLY